MSFKEARLIIDCKLTQITTPNPNDFCTQETKNYINEAYKEANHYRILWTLRYLVFYFVS